MGEALELFASFYHAGRVALDTPGRLAARAAEELGDGRATLDDAFLALTGRPTP